MARVPALSTKLFSNREKLALAPLKVTEVPLVKAVMTSPPTPTSSVPAEFTFQVPPDKVPELKLLDLLMLVLPPSWTLRTPVLFKVPAPENAPLLLSVPKLLMVPNALFVNEPALLNVAAP